MSCRRILVLSCASGYGGAERTIECLVPEIAKSHKVVLAVENELHAQRLESQSTRHRLSIVRYPKGRNILALLESVRRTIRLVHQRKIDAILTNTNKGAMIMALSQYFIPASIPILVFFRDFQWDYAPWIIRRLAGRVRFCAPSAAIEALWPAHYGPRPPSIEVIPDSAFKPTSSGNEAQSTRFLIMGAVSRLKGVDVLIEALALARSRHPDLGLDILGRCPDNEYRTELQAIIDRNDLGAAVKFQSHVEDISPRCFSSLGIVSATIPAHGGPETFGRTIVEAWAHSRPVISTNCGGPGYIISHGKTGLLVEPYDPVGLAEAMCLIAEDKDFRDKLAANGHEEYLRHYTVEAVASLFCEALTSGIRPAV